MAALASLNDFAYNFGHCLFDFLFPVRPLPGDRGAARLSCVLLVMSTQPALHAAQHAACHVSTCSRPGIARS